eukprot:scaffold4565_cov36-Tisochrysis_lutea.AAC.3
MLRLRPTKLAASHFSQRPMCGVRCGPINIAFRGAKCPLQGRMGFACALPTSENVASVQDCLNNTLEPRPFLKMDVDRHGLLTAHTSRW